jgi:hypothetical protein
MRVTLGAISCSNSSHFALMPNSNSARPVAFQTEKTSHRAYVVRLSPDSEPVTGHPGSAGSCHLRTLHRSKTDCHSDKLVALEKKGLGPDRT